MVLSGPQALRSLDDAVRDIRSEERDIARRLSRGTERIAKFQETEAELYRNLAGIRLDQTEENLINDRLSRAETAARDVIKNHARQLTQTQKLIKTLDSKIAVMAEKRRDSLEEVDVAQAEMQALSQKIAAEVQQDPDFAKQRKLADQLQAVAYESLKKTETAEADQELKGQPYRNDVLFMYLWDSGFGTRGYKGINLVRWLDQKVATLVRFNDARANFAMLNEIPVRLREHAQRQIDAAEAAEDELDRLEARAIEKAGGGPIKLALEKAQAQLADIDDEMAKVEDERDEQTNALGELAQGREPAFSKAISNLANSLRGEDIDRLMALARATATPEDDAIIAKIEDARLRIKDEENETRELGARLKILAQRRRELEDIEWEFKKSRFDDPRSQFRKEELVGDLLSEFLRGAISATSYWGQWQRSQTWRPGTNDWGGGIGLPRGGRRSPWSGQTITQWPSSKSSGRSGQRIRFSNKPSSRSGFNRPRTGSRGRRKSGGFKTGGGF